MCALERWLEVSTRLSKGALERGRSAILGTNGMELLRFARTLGHSGSLSNAQPGIIRLASELGWCDERRGRIEPTEIGWIVSDSAREYINWIDDGRKLELPVETEVAGKRVLDVGCGFLTWSFAYGPLPTWTSPTPSASSSGCYGRPAG